MAERSANADLVLELYDAWNAGERERVVSLLTDDAEIRTIRSQLESRAYIGPDGMRESFADWDADWEYVRFAPEEELHERDPFVVVEVRVQTKGRTSGIDLDVPVWFLWEFRGDKVSRVQSFSEREDAMRAAGIEG
jgi:ketosteroid isomerase-like protein